MSKSKRSFVAFILVILLLTTLAVGAEAATLGVYYRPALTFIVENAPKDLLVHVDVERNGEVIPVYLYRETRLWESYFRLYRQTAHEIAVWYGNRADFRNAVLVAETGDSETRIPLSAEVVDQLTMNDFFMLDLKNGAVSFGIPVGRTVLLFLLRLVLTVGAALLVLFLFHYRWLKSWLAALIANLVCQVGMSLFLMNLINYNPKLIILQFTLIVVILILQIPVYWWLLDEDTTQRSVSYAFWSNVATGALNLLFILEFPL